MVHAAATFESQADIYNATFMLHDQQHLYAYAGEFSQVRNSSSDNTWKLNDERLEDGWFIFHLAEFHCHNGTLNDVSFHTVIAVTGETLNVSVKKQHTSGGG